MSTTQRLLFTAIQNGDLETVTSLVEKDEIGLSGLAFDGGGGEARGLAVGSEQLVQGILGKMKTKDSDLIRQLARQINRIINPDQSSDFIILEEIQKVRKGNKITSEEIISSLENRLKTEGGGIIKFTYTGSRKNDLLMGSIRNLRRNPQITEDVFIAEAAGLLTAEGKAITNENITSSLGEIATGLIKNKVEERKGVPISQAKKDLTDDFLNRLATQNGTTKEKVISTINETLGEDIEAAILDGDDIRTLLLAAGGFTNLA